MVCQRVERKREAEADAWWRERKPKPPSECGTNMSAVWSS